jgi:hypothetical protein
MQISPNTNPPSTAIVRELDAKEREDFARLETMVDRGLTGFVEVGNALCEISDRRLYRETHSTFQEYVLAKWKMTARRAYQLCEAAEVVKALPGTVNNCSQSLITNEGQARELAKVEPGKRAGVLEAAASEGQLTARKIRLAANPEPTKPNAFLQNLRVALTALELARNVKRIELTSEELGLVRPLIEQLKDAFLGIGRRLQNLNPPRLKSDRKPANQDLPGSIARR